MDYSLNNIFDSLTVDTLIKNRVHFGHKTRSWNPKMKPYIHSIQSNVHIIDVRKTVECLKAAGEKVFNVIENGGKILFVSTKPSVSSIVKDCAVNCGQHYVVERWLGGMLTNWFTIVKSIRKMKKSKAILEDQENGLIKKEIVALTKQVNRLEQFIGGVSNLRGKPDLAIVFDTKLGNTTTKECNRLGIPVIGIVDTNGILDGVDYPIYGNDDSKLSISFYCNFFSQVILEALKKTMAGVEMKKDDTNNESTEEVASSENKEAENNV